jgi:uncharacterized protein YlxW (UPF0749 family)
VSDRPDGPNAAWARLRAALRPRATRAQLAVALLCALLGFGLVVQVRSARDEPGLSALRQADLVRLLDDQSERSERLRSEVADLEATRERLRTGTDRTRAALQEARRRAQVLGILAGTLPATGPGIVLTVDDPRGTVEAGHLLDAVQELRDAGAEAIQVGGQGGTVRVVVNTHFVDAGTRSGAPAGRGVLVDGTPLRPAYRFVVIGDPDTLAAALEIPGGVLDTLRGLGARGSVEQRSSVTVAALRPLDRPQYARPAPAGSAD